MAGAALDIKSDTSGRAETEEVWGKTPSILTMSCSATGATGISIRHGVDGEVSDVKSDTSERAELLIRQSSCCQVIC